MVARAILFGCLSPYIRFQGSSLLGIQDAGGYSYVSNCTLYSLTSSEPPCVAGPARVPPIHPMVALQPSHEENIQLTGNAGGRYLGGGETCRATGDGLADRQEEFPRTERWGPQLSRRSLRARASHELEPHPTMDLASKIWGRTSKPFVTLVSFSRRLFFQSSSSLLTMVGLGMIG